MNADSKLFLPVCVAGAVAFGFTFAALKRGNEGEVAPQPAGPANPPPVLPAANAPPPPDAEPKPEPPRPVRVRPRTWEMPSKPVEGFEREDYDIIELAVNEDGTRVLTKCRREVHCFDLTASRILKTFLPAKRRWDYQKPDAESLLLSPDARFVAGLSESPLSAKTEDTFLALQVAQTGRTITTLTLPDGMNMYHVLNGGAFSASERTLLLPRSVTGGLAVQTVSTLDGAVGIVPVPNGKRLDTAFTAVKPVPGEPVLIVFRESGRTKANPSGVSAIDLRAGTDRPLTALDVDPWIRDDRAGLQVSPDGKYVLSLGLNKVQVCDWRANRRVFECSVDRYSFDRPRFTPDGRRFVVQRSPQFQIFHITGPQAGGWSSVPSVFELYDVAAAKLIGSYQPSEWAGALVISGDGKTIVYSHRTKLHALDFWTTFGVEPLPPAPRPAGGADRPLE